jgi:hypothetical protein
MALRRRRLLSVFAFGLLAICAQIVGGSLVHRVDIGRHVAEPSYAHASYYPFLLAGVKVGIALLLARLAWRVVRARAAGRAATRLLGALGHPPPPVPRVRVRLSPRLWLAFFALTSAIYLVQASGPGREPLTPWLHSSALPVFAVLAVLCALVWSIVQRWLADYERYAHETVRRALRLVGAGSLAPPKAAALDVAAPRRLFGLSFESRPPPLPA